MQFAFGSGSLWGVESGANPTPGRFGILQDVGVDFAQSIKELNGTYAFPVAIAAGTGKITCKAKFAQLQGRVLNSLFFGGTKAVGQEAVAQDELGTITTGAVTVANGATFLQDLGVRYSATGLPFVRVASAPAVGQYSGPSGAGVYTFNTGENAVVVKIDYLYSIAGTGEKITITNPLMGVKTGFKSVFTQTYNNLRNTLTLNFAMSNKLSVASKLEDFMMPEFDFSAAADAANNIGTWSLGEAS